MSALMTQKRQNKNTKAQLYIHVTSCRILIATIASNKNWEHKVQLSKKGRPRSIRPIIKIQIASFP